MQCEKLRGRQSCATISRRFWMSREPAAECLPRNPSFPPRALMEGSRAAGVVIPRLCNISANFIMSRWLTVRSDASKNSWAYCLRRWPNLQWASTLGALTSFIQPTRQTVPAGNQQPPMSSSGPLQSWWPWQGREGSDAESSNGPPSEPQSASGLPQEKEDDAKKQRSASDSKAQASQPGPSLARWLWRPWDTGGDHGGMTDIDAAVGNPISG